MNNIKIEVDVQPHRDCFVPLAKSLLSALSRSLCRSKAGLGVLEKKKKLSSCADKILPFTSALVPHNDRL
jgi:hypothetical protein